MITMTRVLFVHVLVKLTLPSYFNFGAENIMDFRYECGEILGSTFKQGFSTFLVKL